jgi:hypothetical protein
MAPIQFVSRLTLGLGLSGLAATATYVVGTLALKGVIAVGLQIVPA